MTRWRCCCCAVTGAAPAVPGGLDAAGGRRAQHPADRPGVPGARGHDGAADQPGQEPAPAGRARFTTPPAGELPGRVAAAAQVLYLVFTEGHTSTTGAGLYDVVLADEAIRLTRRLHACLPDAGEVAGLLALMLLTDARRPARARRDGSLVPLAEQDRARWDQALIREGTGLVERALPSGPVGPFQLQAAIAAVHADAARAEDTDWPQIETLYRMLSDLAPGPVVTLNHAVAVAMVDGPSAGLDLLAPLLQDSQLRQHHGCMPCALTCSSWRPGRGSPGRLCPGRPAGHQHPRAAVPQRQGGPARPGRRYRRLAPGVLSTPSARVTVIFFVAMAITMPPAP